GSDRAIFRREGRGIWGPLQEKVRFASGRLDALAVAQLGEDLMRQDALQLNEGTRGGASVEDTVVVEQPGRPLAGFVALAVIERGPPQREGVDRGSADAPDAHPERAEPAGASPSRSVQSEPASQPAQQSRPAAEAQRSPETVDLLDWRFLVVA